MTNPAGRAVAMGCLVASVWLSAAYGYAETARYDVDPDHSIVEFKVTHMVISKTTGHFKDYTGFIEMDPDAGVVKAIEATVKTASVITSQKKRDTHLRNRDFFDVEKYPTMTYKMKSYQKTGDGYTAVGDLTLRGVTKEVTLTGNFNGVTKDPWGNTRAGFTAEGKVNRKEFGMVWNKALDSGGLVVGDEVWIKLDIECIRRNHNRIPFPFFKGLPPVRSLGRQARSEQRI